MVSDVPDLKDLAGRFAQNLSAQQVVEDGNQQGIRKTPINFEGEEKCHSR